MRRSLPPESTADARRRPRPGPHPAAGTDPPRGSRHVAGGRRPRPTPVAGTPPERTTAAPTPASRPDRPDAGRRRWPLPLVVLAAIALALLIVTGLAARAWWQERQLAAARAGALSAARPAAVALASYDYQHLGADFATALSDTTGSFHDQYAKTATTVVKALATKYHAVVSARFLDAGVVAATSNQVTVVVFLDQTTRSNKIPAPRTDQDRLQLTMSQVHGRWLVSDLRVL